VEAWFPKRSQYISCSCREAFHGGKEQNLNSLSV
jgi:hypothetical protein